MTNLMATTETFTITITVITTFLSPSSAMLPHLVTPYYASERRYVISLGFSLQTHSSYLSRNTCLFIMCEIFKLNMQMCMLSQN